MARKAPDQPPNPSQRERLMEARDLLRTNLLAAKPREVATLTLAYMKVLDKLETMAVPVEESKRDELARRRAQRHSDAADSAPAARRSQSRRSNGSHRTG